MIEISFDNAKYSTGTSVESTTFTKLQSKLFVSEWRVVFAGLMSRERIEKQSGCFMWLALISPIYYWHCTSLYRRFWVIRIVIRQCTVPPFT